MAMLSRANQILKVLQNELLRHQKAIELDDTISKITFEIIIGKRLGDPVKIRYATASESDLTAQ